MSRTLWIVGAGIAGTIVWTAATRSARSPSDASRSLDSPVTSTRNARARYRVSPRNDRLAYRSVGSPGEPYPHWIRALKDKAGVYLIRDRETGELVYIGSSAGRLYATITRHFQSWRRSKGFWRGHYSKGHDPGMTYERSSVEVAVRLTASDAALDEEMRLISRMNPRDNLIGQAGADEEVPF